MNDYQKMVKEFHVAFAAPAPDRLDLSAVRRTLRAALIKEEALEFQEAAHQVDYVGMIDALCDLLYVTFGTAVEMGIDLDQYFREVHRSNMSKLVNGRPLLRVDGKILKGPNYTPPDLKGILNNEL